ncbi:hypothetical protein Taro_009570 [Colocasia esculenta]|uniref:CCHC-type domain-containing protein n=1 Tax=Colocasia esculenta TaxID=4460 RepID=A0A843U555_COLES|nr:hypothetical protein [Colocasia esculenta]
MVGGDAAPLEGPLAGSFPSERVGCSAGAGDLSPGGCPPTLTAFNVTTSTGLHPSCMVSSGVVLPEGHENTKSFAQILMKSVKPPVLPLRAHGLACTDSGEPVAFFTLEEVLQVDRDTLCLSCTHAARVCVQLDVTKKLPDRSCRRLGHITSKCKKSISSDNTSAPVGQDDDNTIPIVTKSIWRPVSNEHLRKDHGKAMATNPEPVDGGISDLLGGSSVDPVASLTHPGTGERACEGESAWDGGRACAGDDAGNNAGLKGPEVSNMHDAAQSLVQGLREDLQFIWELWCSRNRARFDSQPMSARQVLYKVMMAVRDSLSAFPFRDMDLSPAHRRLLHCWGISVPMLHLPLPRIIKWLSPPSGRLKLNVDGAFKAGSSTAAGGGNLRNVAGDIIFAFASRYCDWQAMLETVAGLTQALQNVVQAGNQATIVRNGVGDLHRNFRSLNPPRFSGSPDSDEAENWQKEIERIFHVMQCTNREKVIAHLPVYAPHLVGTERLKANRFMDGLRPMFIEKLGPHNIQTYTEMVQRAQLVEDTMAKVEAIKGKDISKPTIIKRGLVDATGTFHNNNYNNNIRQTTAKDYGMEKKIKVEETMTVEYCKFCDKPGHQADKCWKKARACLRCGSEEHHIPNCPMLKGQVGRNQGVVKHQVRVNAITQAELPKGGDYDIQEEELVEDGNASELVAFDHRTLDEALNAACRQESEMEQYLEEKKTSLKRPKTPFQWQDRKKAAYQSPQRPMAAGSQQVASQRSPGSRPSGKKECPHCRRAHGGTKCWKLAGKCLKCRSSEHQIRDFLDGCFFLLKMKDYDTILGLELLEEHYALVDYRGKKIHFYIPAEDEFSHPLPRNIAGKFVISTMRAMRMINKACDAFLASMVFSVG